MESALLPEPLPETTDASTLATQWTRFKRQLAWFIAATDKTKAKDAAKIGILLRTVGPRGVDIYDNFSLTGAERGEYTTVVKAFDDYCKPRVNLFAARHKFLTMKQGEQTIDQFITALRKQARDYCDFGNTVEDWTLHALTLGLTDDATRRRLFEKENLDLDKAIKLCRMVEDTQREMAGLRLNEEAHAVYNKRGPPLPPRAAAKRPEAKRGAGCKYCGATHPPRQCPAYGKKCNACGSMNHYARVCMKSGPAVSAVNHRDDDDVNMLADQSGSEGSEEAWLIHVEREGRKLVTKLQVSGNGIKERRWLKAQLDTAATCNILSYQAYELLGKPILQQSNTKLNMYNGAIELSLGKCALTVGNSTTPMELSFEVVNSQNLTLLSLDSCLALNLLSVNQCVNLVEEQKADSVEWAIKHYQDVFAGLGRLEGEYNIVMDHSVTPVQNRPRRIPFALRDDLTSKLESLEKQGIIAKVDRPTPWIANLLAMRKPSGSIRVCLDPTDLNKAIERNHYQLPTLEDVLPTLKDGKVFSLVDAKDGFLQIALTEESSYLTTFWTPKGRYRWTRMPFGLSSSPEEFQRRLNIVLEGLEGIAVVADDVLVVGRGSNEAEAMKDHDKNFVALLQRAREKGLRLNKDKLRLKLKEIPYIGHILSRDGVRADPAKQKDIERMKTPKTVEELRRFLGYVNYLSRFMPHLASVTEPMRALLVKGVEFRWNEEQEGAFKAVKRLAQTSETLGYFDPSKPVVLQCDASIVGLGGVLLQDAIPVAYASRALTKSERNYAPIELECLAVVYGCHRFDQYIYGHPNVTVNTDHQPLESIFHKSLLQTPKRLQRMRLMLQRYDFTVKYCPGAEQVIADMLSRAPRQEDLPVDLGTEQVFQLSEWQKRSNELDGVDPEEHAHVGDGKLRQVREASSQDSELLVLRQTVEAGWPSTRGAARSEVRQYWNFRDEIALFNDILYKGERIILPKAMRQQVLKNLHSSHQGVEATLRRARDSVFWPGLTADVKQMSENCPSCQASRSSQPKETLRSHTIPDRPWAKIGTDLFQTKSQEHYIIMVDYYSDYFEINRLSSLESSAVIAAMKEQFARHGTPEVVHSDGGPQYAAEAFARFATTWGFEHTMSSPYHSQSNGKAESAVKIAKNMLSKAEDPYAALLEWRNTPSYSTTSSPVQRLFSRRTRNTVPQSGHSLKPRAEDGSQVVDMKMKGAFKAQQNYNVGAKELPVMKVGQPVYVQDLRRFAEGRWNTGRIAGICSDRSYIVETGGKKLRRNRRYIRTASDEARGPNCARSERTEKTVAELPVQRSCDQGPSCARSERADLGITAADLPARGQSRRQGQSCVWRERAEWGTSAADLPAQERVCERRERTDLGISVADLPNPEVIARMTRSGRVSKQPSHLQDYEQ